MSMITKEFLALDLWDQAKVLRNIIRQQENPKDLRRVLQLPEVRKWMKDNAKQLIDECLDNLPEK